MRTRAYRRHQTRRVRAKARKVFQSEFDEHIAPNKAARMPWFLVQKHSLADIVCRRADNMQVCSCWGCGNRRAVEGDTRQERRMKR